MDPVSELVIEEGVKATISSLVGRLFSNPRSALSPSSMAGDWHMHWVISQPSTYDPKSIVDVVRLKVDRKGNVSGQGLNAFYGAYVLTGTDSMHTLTLAYRPKRDRVASHGVCLIIKTADISSMDGVWWQHDPRHGIIGGVVTMKPLKNP